MERKEPPMHSPKKINSHMKLTIIECESDSQLSMQTCLQDPPSTSNSNETPQPSLPSYCNNPMPNFGPDPPPPKSTYGQDPPPPKSTYGQDQYGSTSNSQYQQASAAPGYRKVEDEYLPKPVPVTVTNENGQPSTSNYDQDTRFSNQDHPIPKEIYSQGMRPLSAYCTEDSNQPMQTIYQDQNAPKKKNYRDAEPPMQDFRQAIRQDSPVPMPHCHAEHQLPVLSKSQLMVQICAKDSSADREEYLLTPSQEPPMDDDPCDPKKLYRVTVRQKITRKPGGALLHHAITSQPSLQDSVSPMIHPSLRQLKFHDRIIIHQKCSNFCLCFIKNSYYRVKDSKGNQMFEITEATSCLMRCCCCFCRSFTMKIVDRENKEVMQLKRPMMCGQCCCCCGTNCMLCCLTEMDVLGATPPYLKFGRVKQNFSCFSPSFTCHNDLGQRAFSVRGNCCRLPCTNHYYKVKSEGTDGIPLGNIIKKWRGCITECCTNAHSLEVQFEKITTLEDRIMMLSTAILIDFLYYT